MKTRSYLNLTQEQAERWYYEGRITERQWRTFCRCWDWAAPRYSGVAGHKQSCFANRFGHAAYVARINRLRRAMGLDLYAN
jgi:hypothetical protein